MALKLVTPATAYPVTVDECLTNSRLPAGLETELIQSFIGAATERAQIYTGRQFVTATWRLTLDYFPCEIIVPKPPLLSVASVEYRSAADTWTAVDTDLYWASTEADPGKIYLAYGQSWPAPICLPESVRVTYQAGYGGADAVPAGIKVAIKFLVGYWALMGREGQELPPAFHHLLDPYWTGCTDILGLNEVA